jgi:hypothetical protein
MDEWIDGWIGVKAFLKGMLCAVKKRFKIPILTIKIKKYIF